MFSEGRRDRSCKEYSAGLMQYVKFKKYGDEYLESIVLYRWCGLYEGELCTFRLWMKR